MGRYVAERVVKSMIKKGLKILNSDVLQLGISFKENCPDIRNSHAVDVIYGLQDFGCNVDVYDPWAEPEEVKKYYGITSTKEVDEASIKAAITEAGYEYAGIVG